MTRHHEDHHRTRDVDPDAVLAADIAALNAVLNELIDVNDGWAELMEYSELRQAVRRFRRIRDAHHTPTGNTSPPCAQAEPDDPLQVILQTLNRVSIQVDRIEQFNDLLAQNCPAAADEARFGNREIRALVQGLHDRTLSKQQALFRINRCYRALDQVRTVIQKSEEHTHQVTRRRLGLVRGFAEDACSLLPEVLPHIARLFAMTRANL